MSLTAAQAQSLQLSVPRPQGDGMDSETLRQQEFSPQTQRKMSSRHRNLNASHKAATVARTQQPRYVPKEPVKGAVRAVAPSSGPTGLSKMTTAHQLAQTPPRGKNNQLTGPINSTPVTRSNYLPQMAAPVSPINSSAASQKANPAGIPQGAQMIPYTVEKKQSTICRGKLNSPLQTQYQQTKYTHNTQSNTPPSHSVDISKVKPLTDASNVQSTVTVVSNRTHPPGSSHTEPLVRNISVPVYQGPGHLHIKTYETLKNANKMSNDQPLINAPFSVQNKDMEVGSSNAGGVNIGHSYIGKVATGINTKPQGDVLNTGNKQCVQHALNSGHEIQAERCVEGDDKTSDSTREIKKLQELLDVQLKVNTDLKKMLVASMGDDLHYKVEALVRTKAQLALEVGGYSEKLYQGYEEVDKLAIQADIWHSKYRATQMLVEDLTKQRGQVWQKYEQAQYALETLIQEHHQVKDFMVMAYKHLHQLKNALGPHHRGAKITSQPTSVLDLAKTNSQLADSVRFSLLGAIPPMPSTLDSSTLVSPAEQIAYQVLYQARMPELESVTMGAELGAMTRPLATPMLEQYSRFHPQIRYDNLTINCCRKCKGDIHVV